jgi:fatty acid desaturase
MADLTSFAAALDALRARVEAEMGDRDVRYVERVDRASKWLATVGRTWIAASSGPIGFFGGVVSLWVGKQLQATEIGHTAMHGAYDRFPEAKRFHAHEFAWKTPIPEAVWSSLHDRRHALPSRELAPTRTALQIAGTVARIAVKATPYYAREYFVLPAVAGPLWWKVLVGNALSEILRDVVTVTAVYAAHGGDVRDVEDRAERYRMQVEAQTNIAVPWVVSVLCGGMDRAIEHHLFPKLPPHRLREIAGDVRRICEEHSVTYKVDGLGSALRKVFRRRGIFRAA